MGNLCNSLIPLKAMHHISYRCEAQTRIDEGINIVNACWEFLFARKLATNAKKEDGDFNQLGLGCTQAQTGFALTRLL